MTDESTVREIMFSRCRGHFSLLRDIEKNTAWRRQRMEAQEKQWIQDQFPYRPSKIFPEIMKWMQLFTDKIIDKTRFPFFVLNGDPNGKKSIGRPFGWEIQNIDLVMSKHWAS